MTKRTKGVVFAVAVVCLGLQLMAQTSRHVVVHAGHLLDVKSGKVLADQMLVIEDGKIVISDNVDPCQTLFERTAPCTPKSAPFRSS